ncbi:MAG: phosphatidylserine decarboxylase [Verrucomicrobia bacterium]|nr:phosphatidylserine decarboxylase [Verrucomicrobiota bacterium]MBS0646304.1 phosphatidylserine decarboxylase [Verrucomicrobiota bacterium]
MKQDIFYIDRRTGQRCKEQIYFEAWLRFFYGTNPIGRWAGNWIARLSCLSKFVGFLQRAKSSKKKILPFIQRYHVPIEEAQLSIDQFASFNDFFIRKLKPEARPLSADSLVIPADGRYLLYPNMEEADGFLVKGDKFHLDKFLDNKDLAAKYRQGSLLIARLCPTDYHRFHFPCDCRPHSPVLINGWLHSVSPLALRHHIYRLAENKRVLTLLQSSHHGDILFCEVGATNVGSIHQTFTPYSNYKKGAEKGFFSFGGSTLILLFEKQSVAFSHDLIKNSSQHIETLCLIGQPLGNIK